MSDLLPKDVEGEPRIQVLVNLYNQKQNTPPVLLSLKVLLTRKGYLTVFKKFYSAILTYILLLLVISFITVSYICCCYWWLLLLILACLLHFSISFQVPILDVEKTVEKTYPLFVVDPSIWVMFCDAVKVSSLDKAAKDAWAHAAATLGPTADARKATYR